MSFKTIIDTIQQDSSGWLVIFLIMMSLIQISPIKFNPWTRLRQRVSEIFNKETTEKIKGIENDVDELKKSFCAIHQESHEQRVDSIRMVIIDAARELKKENGKITDPIDIEYLSQINKKCDMYEHMCEEYNISNGVAAMSIAYIRDVYKKSVL